MVRWFAAGLALAWIGLSFDPSTARAGLLSPDDERIYRSAFQAADDGKFDYARGLARKAPNPLLDHVLAWLEYQHPGSGATFEQITQFVRANPTWPQIPTLTRRAEEAISAATPNDLLRAWFEAYPPSTAEGAMAYARALQAEGAGDKATELLRHAWVAFSFGPVQEREMLTHFADAIRPGDDVARLDRLLWDRQYDAATTQMRRVDEGRKRLARARMALARESSRGEALATNVFEADRHDPGLVYELTRYRREHDHEDDAIALLKDPGADKGRPDLWWSERSALARYALEKGNITQAYQIASNHGAIEGQPYMEAEWLAGWIALRFLHDTQTAQEHFSRLYEHVVTPVGRGRGAYWTGRAYEEAGDVASAQHWYGLAAENVTSFYGQLAAARCGHDGLGALPSDPTPTTDDIANFQRDELARVARVLGEIGQTDLMRAFLLRLVEVSSSPGMRTQAAALAVEMDRPDIAITVAHRSEREGIPLLASGYPIPPLSIADNPERALVLGLVRQESGFHHEAVSSAGARGLMQLMPATAAKLARAINLVFKRKNALAVALTQNPGLNLKLGSAYLADLLNQFNGSYILAIAAYNAGPSRVEKWVREYGDPRTRDVDAVDWIESIPFAETRNYVQRVMEGVQVYRRRLGGTGVALTLDEDLKRPRGD